MKQLMKQPMKLLINREIKEYNRIVNRKFFDPSKFKDSIKEYNRIVEKGKLGIHLDRNTVEDLLIDQFEKYIRENNNFNNNPNDFKYFENEEINKKILEENEQINEQILKEREEREEKEEKERKKKKKKQKKKKEKKRRNRRKRKKRKRRNRKRRKRK